MVFGMAMMPLDDIERFLWEDIGDDDDSNELVPRSNIKAIVVAKQDGVVAGLEEACAIFTHLGLACKAMVTDGSGIKKGQRMLEVEGDSWAVLKCERVVLNMMSRMSGIATLTRRCVDRAGGIKVAATRKTTPGFRRYEKKAVKLGGGDTHRYDLSDAIMIKDNHQGLDDMVALINRARLRSFTKKVEVEAHCEECAENAARAGADIVMLDNFKPGKVAELVHTIREIDPGITIEASGGINPENISEYAGTGVDLVSMGALTHSAPALDFSLDII